MNALPPATLDVLHAAASWFLDQRTLPRHSTVRACESEFRRNLALLIPQVAQLAGALAGDDASARAATAAIAEARERLEECEAAGLRGEVERVRRIAHSVIAVSDRYESLTSIQRCLTCGRPNEPITASASVEGPAAS